VKMWSKTSYNVFHLPKCTVLQKIQTLPTVEIDSGTKRYGPIGYCHRLLKIRSDGSHARVRELGFIGLLGRLLYFC